MPPKHRRSPDTLGLLRQCNVVRRSIRVSRGGRWSYRVALVPDMEWRTMPVHGLAIPKTKFKEAHPPKGGDELGMA